MALLAAAACAPPARFFLPEPSLAEPAGISAEAWRHALMAHQHASELGKTERDVLAVIDYTLPSSERRLWVVDLASGAVLINTYVAHGMGSGGTRATAFSNRWGSRQSSLGTFLTADDYRGVKGLALRLEGLEPGINDRARVRGIVFHGTGSVNPARARANQLGRTEGCPAVPYDVVRRLVRLIEGGVVVFAWYPDPRFLARSEFLDRRIVPQALGTSD